MSVLTEDDVRKMLAENKLNERGVFYLEDKQIITPSAKAYLTEKNIAIIPKNKLEKDKTEEDVKGYKTVFGATLYEKPEHMTHLRGNVLVFKDHPRIALRGAIDALESALIITQVRADEQNRKKLVEDLQEILDFIRGLMSCEVSGKDVGDFKLQNLTPQELREHSHHPSKYYGMGHFLPTYKHGELVARLNELRTLTRKTELIAYKAFTDSYGVVEREDIIKAFNRLSSLFWIMMFKYLTKYYEN